MILLNELGTKKYKPYVQLLEDSLIKLEKSEAVMEQSIEEINKERKYVQVFLDPFYVSKNSRKAVWILLTRK